MTDKAYAVPLHELLASVPREARLVIDDDDGMGTRFIPVGRYCNEAAEALRARLAQPEQEPEPELWGCKFNKGNRVDTFYTKSAAERYVEGSLRNGADVSLVGLYTAPPQREWQGLTENEIKHLWYEACQTNLELTSQLIVHLARNIEAKLKDKNEY